LHSVELVPDTRTLSLSKREADLTRDILLGVHVDIRHVLRVRAAMDAVVEAQRSNSAILDPGAKAPQSL